MSSDSAPPATRYGALGISSFVLSLITFVGLFLDVGVAGYASVTGTATRGFNMIVGMIVFLCLFLGLIAIGLGIAGWRDKTSKPGFSIAGIAISAGALVLTGAIMFLGLSQKG
jgi:hypothetical protein